MKKFRIFAVLALGISLLLPVTSQATMPVLDYTNLIQNTVNFIKEQVRFVQSHGEQVRQTYNQMQQIQNQLELIKYTLRNLRQVDAKTLAGAQNSLHYTIGNMETLMSGVNGITYNFSTLKGQYNDLYLKYDALKNKSPYQQQQLIEKIQAQIANANKDAMDAQAIHNIISKDMATLKMLQAKNGTAQGALEASQIANEIAIKNTQQLMQLQMIMAESMRATTSIQEAERVRADMARAENAKFFQYKKEKLKASGTGLIKLQ